ncbi:toxin-antitoxin system YwqK family antitoxin [Aquimarina litoralis]|uniref:toxin-antitoxin system YwqK family antitoxin n=1 Tax=Aquimarina litoralis TaxID=584605 RepID=UPI001C56AD08|nr:hypothetical protein [Aquimarina litoralis]MBW1297507.1 hypothetical protein [Aquimarina litoralis]
MMKHLLFIVSTLLFFSFQTSYQKEYHREYYSDGSIKAEGWKINNQKTDYWYSYYPDGNVLEKGHFKNNKKQGYWYFYSSENKLLKEGHFINNKAEKWWIIYDIATINKKDRVTRKFQYRNNKKNGYCLLYKNDKLFKAEKYIDNQKMGEWTDVFSFKKDNPNASL